MSKTSEVASEPSARRKEGARLLETCRCADAVYEVHGMSDLDRGEARDIVLAARKALLDFCEAEPPKPEPCPSRRVKAGKLLGECLCCSEDNYVSPSKKNRTRALAAEEALLDAFESSAVHSPAEVSALEWAANYLRKAGGPDANPIDEPHCAAILDGIREGGVVMEPGPAGLSAEEVSALERAAQCYRALGKRKPPETGSCALSTFDSIADVLDGIRERGVVMEPGPGGLSAEEEGEVVIDPPSVRSYLSRRVLELEMALAVALSKPGPTFAAMVADRDRLAGEVIDLKSRGVVLLVERDDLKSELTTARDTLLSESVRLKLEVEGLKLEGKRHRALAAETLAPGELGELLGTLESAVVNNFTCGPTLNEAGAALKAARQTIVKAWNARFEPAPGELGALLDALGSAAVVHEKAHNLYERLSLSDSNRPERVEALRVAVDVLWDARNAVISAFTRRAKPAESCPECEKYAGTIEDACRLRDWMMEHFLHNELHGRRIVDVVIKKLEGAASLRQALALLGHATSQS